MKNRETNDSGIALIVALLFILLLTIMMLGFYFQTTGEQNVAASDRDNTVTFYAAQGAIENMSSNIGDLIRIHRLSHTRPDCRSDRRQLPAEHPDL